MYGNSVRAAHADFKRRRRKLPVTFRPNCVKIRLPRLLCCCFRKKNKDSFNKPTNSNGDHHSKDGDISPLLREITATFFEKEFTKYHEKDDFQHIEQCTSTATFLSTSFFHVSRPVQYDTYPVSVTYNSQANKLRKNGRWTKISNNKMDVSTQTDYQNLPSSVIDKISRYVDLVSAPKTLCNKETNTSNFSKKSTTVLFANHSKMLESTDETSGFRIEEDTFANRSKKKKTVKLKTEEGKRNCYTSTSDTCLYAEIQSKFHEWLEFMQRSKKKPTFKSNSNHCLFPPNESSSSLILESPINSSIKSNHQLNPPSKKISPLCKLKVRAFSKPKKPESQKSERFSNVRERKEALSKVAEFLVSDHPILTEDVQKSLNKLAAYRQDLEHPRYPKFIGMEIKKRPNPPTDTPKKRRVPKIIIGKKKNNVERVISLQDVDSKPQPTLLGDIKKVDAEIDKITTKIQEYLDVILLDVRDQKSSSELAEGDAMQGSLKSSSSSTEAEPGDLELQPIDEKFMNNICMSTAPVTIVPLQNHQFQIKDLKDLTRACKQYEEQPQGKFSEKHEEKREFKLPNIFKKKTTTTHDGLRTATREPQLAGFLAEVSTSVEDNWIEKVLSDADLDPKTSEKEVMAGRPFGALDFAVDEESMAGPSLYHNADRSMMAGSSLYASNDKSTNTKSEHSVSAAVQTSNNMRNKKLVVSNKKQMLHIGVQTSSASPPSDVSVQRETEKEKVIYARDRKVIEELEERRRRKVKTYFHKAKSAMIGLLNKGKYEHSYTNTDFFDEDDDDEDFESDETSSTSKEPTRVKFSNVIMEGDASDSKTKVISLPGSSSDIDLSDGRKVNFRKTMVLSVFSSFYNNADDRFFLGEKKPQNIFPGLTWLGGGDNFEEFALPTSKFDYNPLRSVSTYPVITGKNRPKNDFSRLLLENRSRKPKPIYSKVKKYRNQTDLTKKRPVETLISTKNPEIIPNKFRKISPCCQNFPTNLFESPKKKGAPKKLNVNDSYHKRLIDLKKRTQPPKKPPTPSEPSDKKTEELEPHQRDTLLLLEEPEKNPIKSTDPENKSAITEISNEELRNITELEERSAEVEINEIEMKPLQKNKSKESIEEQLEKRRRDHEIKWKSLQEESFQFKNHEDEGHQKASRPSRRKKRNRDEPLRKPQTSPTENLSGDDNFAFNKSEEKLPAFSPREILAQSHDGNRRTEDVNNSESARNKRIRKDESETEPKSNDEEISEGEEKRFGTAKKKEEEKGKDTSFCYRHSKMLSTIEKPSRDDEEICTCEEIKRQEPQKGEEKNFLRKTVRIIEPPATVQIPCGSSLEDWQETKEANDEVVASLKRPVLNEAVHRFTRRTSPEVIKEKMEPPGPSRMAKNLIINEEPSLADQISLKQINPQEDQKPEGNENEDEINLRGEKVVIKQEEVRKEKKEEAPKKLERKLKKGKRPKGKKTTTEEGDQISPKGINPVLEDQRRDEIEFRHKINPEEEEVVIKQEEVIKEEGILKEEEPPKKLKRKLKKEKRPKGTTPKQRDGVFRRPNRTLWKKFYEDVLKEILPAVDRNLLTEKMDGNHDGSTKVKKKMKRRKPAALRHPTELVGDIKSVYKIVVSESEDPSISQRGNLERRRKKKWWKPKRKPHDGAKKNMEETKFEISLRSSLELTKKNYERITSNEIIMHLQHDVGEVPKGPAKLTLVHKEEPAFSSTDISISERYQPSSSTSSDDYIFRPPPLIPGKLRDESHQFDLLHPKSLYLTAGLRQHCSNKALMNLLSTYAWKKLTKPSTPGIQPCLKNIPDVVEERDEGSTVSTFKFSDEEPVDLEQLKVDSETKAEEKEPKEEEPKEEVFDPVVILHGMLREEETKPSKEIGDSDVYRYDIIINEDLPQKEAEKLKVNVFRVPKQPPKVAGPPKMADPKDAFEYASSGVGRPVLEISGELKTYMKSLGIFEPTRPKRKTAASSAPDLTGTKEDVPLDERHVVLDIKTLKPTSLESGKSKMIIRKSNPAEDEDVDNLQVTLRDGNFVVTLPEKYPLTDSCGTYCHPSTREESSKTVTSRFDLKEKLLNTLGIVCKPSKEKIKSSASIEPGKKRRKERKVFKFLKRDRRKSPQFKLSRRANDIQKKTKVTEATVTEPSYEEEHEKSEENPKEEPKADLIEFLPCGECGETCPLKKEWEGKNEAKKKTTQEGAESTKPLSHEVYEENGNLKRKESPKETEDNNKTTQREIDVTEPLSNLKEKDEVNKETTQEEMEPLSFENCEEKCLLKKKWEESLIQEENGKEQLDENSAETTEKENESEKPNEAFISEPEKTDWEEIIERENKEKTKRSPSRSLIDKLSSKRISIKRSFKLLKNYVRNPSKGAPKTKKETEILNPFRIFPRCSAIRKTPSGTEDSTSKAKTPKIKKLIIKIQENKDRLKVKTPKRQLLPVSSSSPPVSTIETPRASTSSSSPAKEEPTEEIPAPKQLIPISTSTPPVSTSSSSPAKEQPTEESVSTTETPGESTSSSEERSDRLDGVNKRPCVGVRVRVPFEEKPGLLGECRDPCERLKIVIDRPFKPEDEDGRKLNAVETKKESGSNITDDEESTGPGSIFKKLDVPSSSLAHVRKRRCSYFRRRNEERRERILAQEIMKLISIKRPKRRMPYNKYHALFALTEGVNVIWEAKDIGGSSFVSTSSEDAKKGVYYCLEERSTFNQGSWSRSVSVGNTEFASAFTVNQSYVCHSDEILNVTDAGTDGNKRELQDFVGYAKMPSPLEELGLFPASQAPTRRKKNGESLFAGENFPTECYMAATVGNQSESEGASDAMSGPSSSASNDPFREMYAAKSETTVAKKGSKEGRPDARAKTAHPSHSTEIFCPPTPTSNLPKVFRGCTDIIQRVKRFHQPMVDPIMKSNVLCPSRKNNPQYFEEKKKRAKEKAGAKAKKKEEKKRAKGPVKKKKSKEGKKAKSKTSGVSIAETESHTSSTKTVESSGPSSLNCDGECQTEGLCFCKMGNDKNKSKHSRSVEQAGKNKRDFANTYQARIKPYTCCIHAKEEGRSYCKKVTFDKKKQKITDLDPNWVPPGMEDAQKDKSTSNLTICTDSSVTSIERVRRMVNKKKKGKKQTRQPTFVPCNKPPTEGATTESKDDPNSKFSGYASKEKKGKRKGRSKSSSGSTSSKDTSQSQSNKVPFFQRLFKKKPKEDPKKKGHDPNKKKCKLSRKVRSGSERSASEDGLPTCQCPKPPQPPQLEQPTRKRRHKRKKTPPKPHDKKKCSKCTAKKPHTHPTSPTASPQMSPSSSLLSLPRAESTKCACNVIEQKKKGRRTPGIHRRPPLPDNKEQLTSKSSQPSILKKQDAEKSDESRSRERKRSVSLEETAVEKRSDPHVQDPHAEYMRKFCQVEKCPSFQDSQDYLGPQTSPPVPSPPEGRPKKKKAKKSSSSDLKKSSSQESKGKCKSHKKKPSGDTKKHKRQPHKDAGDNELARQSSTSKEQLKSHEDTAPAQPKKVTVNVPESHEDIPPPPPKKKKSKERHERKSKGTKEDGCYCDIRKELRDAYSSPQSIPSSKASKTKKDPSKQHVAKRKSCCSMRRQKSHTEKPVATKARPSSETKLTAKGAPKSRVISRYPPEKCYDKKQKKKKKQQKPKKSSSKSSSKKHDHSGSSDDCYCQHEDEYSGKFPVTPRSSKVKKKSSCSGQKQQKQPRSRGGSSAVSSEELVSKHDYDVRRLEMPANIVDVFKKKNRAAPKKDEIFDTLISMLFKERKNKKCENTRRRMVKNYLSQVSSSEFEEIVLELVRKLPKGLEDVMVKNASERSMQISKALSSLILGRKRSSHHDNQIKYNVSKSYLKKFKNKQFQLDQSLLCSKYIKKKQIAITCSDAPDCSCLTPPSSEASDVTEDDPFKIDKPFNLMHQRKTDYTIDIDKVEVFCRKIPSDHSWRSVSASENEKKRKIDSAVKSLNPQLNNEDTKEIMEVIKLLSQLSAKDLCRFFSKQRMK